MEIECYSERLGDQIPSRLVENFSHLCGRNETSDIHCLGQKNDSLVFVFLLSMLIRCGMQVMNMVVRPCQGCQSHLFTYKAYLMPSNQTTNQLTSDKRKCFLSLSCSASLSLILLLPFLLFRPQCDEYAYRERETHKACKSESLLQGVCISSSAAVFFCQVGDPSRVKSSSSSSLLFSQLAVRRNESMLFNLAPLT